MADSQRVNPYSHMESVPTIVQSHAKIGPNDVDQRGYANMSTAAQSNEPNRFELFILGDGEKKVTEAADTRK